jgi:hypothetical protein
VLLADLADIRIETNSCILEFVKVGLSAVSSPDTEQLRARVANVKKRILQLPPGSEAQLDVQILEVISGMYNHLVMAYESRLLHVQAQAAFSECATPITMPPSHNAFKTGQTSGKAWRLVVPLKLLLATFRQICRVLLPRWHDATRDLYRKGSLCACHVLRIALPPTSESPCKLMLADKFVDWTFRFKADQCWIQAIELQPPKPGAISIRYQINSNAVHGWPSKLTTISNHLSASLMHAYAALTDVDRAALPFPATSYLDMPVVVPCHYYHYY